MMKLLRRHRDWLMIVIAILAIPFIFYFVQRPDYGAIGRDQFARIYDRNCFDAGSATICTASQSGADPWHV